MSENSEQITASVNLKMLGRPLHLEMMVPTGLTRPSRMLPLFRSLTESFVGLAVENIQAEGMEISCDKGCGACCRQMVPVAKFEAQQLRDLVHEMPEPRKSIILERFEKAIKRFEEAGLLEKLRHPEQITTEEYREFGLKYFFQNVACPFLEDESCSIHLERPLVCREYLVVSVPENCSRQNGEPIKVLNIPAEMSKAVRDLEKLPDEPSWIPLILALEWADAHTEETPEMPGPDLLKALFQNLTGRKIPQSN